jgi:CheY-like chemotaxis protein
MQGTIIVAEKSRTVRRMVEIALAKHPFNLVFAADAASAVDLLRSESPVLAIVDAGLPGNGYEVAGHIKKKSDARVILLVGRNENFDLSRAREAAVDGHLTKPFVTQQLVEKVFSALGLPVPDKTLFRVLDPPIQGKARPGLEAPASDSLMPAPPSAAPAPPAPTAVAKATPAPPPKAPAAAAPSAPPPPAKTPPKAPPGPPLPPPTVAKAPPQRPQLPSVPPVSSAAAPALPSHAPAPPPVGAFEGGPNAVTPPGVQVTQEALKQTMLRVAKDPAITSALNAASREALERVVWEVVPKLAEAILKEEIAKAVRERLAAS